MAARTTRREARERIIKSFMDSLDRIIPPDEQVAVAGSDVFGLGAAGGCDAEGGDATLLQERAALDGSAAVEAGAVGKCPRCGSDRIYLDHGGQESQKEVISPHGPVVIAKQQLSLPSLWPVFSLRIVNGVCRRGAVDAQAACRLGREAATQQGFAPAARALSEDWGTEEPLHDEQVRRWPRRWAVGGG